MEVKRIRVSFEGEGNAEMVLGTVVESAGAVGGREKL